MVLCTTLLLSPFAPPLLAIAAGIGNVGGLLVFTQVMLRKRKLEARLLQTLTAQFAVGSLFALALFPASKNDPASDWDHREWKYVLTQR